MEAVLQPVSGRGFDGIGVVLKAMCTSASEAENLNRQVRTEHAARLVAPILSEISEEWETGKIDLSTEGMPACPAFTNLRTKPLHCLFWQRRRCRLYWKRPSLLSKDLSLSCPRENISPQRDFASQPFTV
jgi:hypothetical protein